MAASDNMGEQFRMLHGSPIRIPIGEQLKGAKQVSTPERIKSRTEANPGYRADRVYMSPQPITALQYTWTDEDISEQRKTPSGYIHVVEPIGRLLKDTSSRGAIISGSRHARGAIVRGSFPAKAIVTGEVDTEEEAQAYRDYMDYMNSRG